MKQASEARCTVGLLTWNVGEGVVPCIESLLAQTEQPLSILWYDNASEDDTVAVVRRHLPCADHTVLARRNSGFCGGHGYGLRRASTRYYLALNQDVVLAPDYLEKLCDWMDERPDLALAQGMIYHDDPREQGANTRISAAGLVLARTRFPFSLARGQRRRPELEVRREVAGVDGSAIVFNVELCRRATDANGDILPRRFFAYGEEVDLAQRLARAGCAMGCEGTTWAAHEGQTSGGLRRAAIRRRFYCNHWLIALRNDGWGLILRELPYILRGELQYRGRDYLRHPLIFMQAVGTMLGEAREARRHYREFERRHGPTQQRLRANRELALRQIRESAGSK